ncbi:MAG: helix-turn-helix domain-containing protein [Pseudomonadota bacterium]
MKRASFADKPCSIARSLDVLGDWWNPLILRECLYGVTRFDEIQRWLGIGRNILTTRLSQLIDAGLLEKVPYSDTPRRYEYRLTDRGYDAALVLVAMMQYGERWHFPRGEVPIQLYDRRTHEPVKAMLVDATSGEPINVRELYAGPGPAFPPADSVRRDRFREYFQHHDQAAD